MPRPPLTLGAILCPVSPFLGLTKQVPNRKQKTGLSLEVLYFKLKSLNVDITNQRPGQSDWIPGQYTKCSGVHLNPT